MQHTTMLYYILVTSGLAILIACAQHMPKTRLHESSRHEDVGVHALLCHWAQDTPLEEASRRRLSKLQTVWGGLQAWQVYKGWSEERCR